MVVIVMVRIMETARRPAVAKDFASFRGRLWTSGVRVIFISMHAAGAQQRALGERLFHSPSTGKVW